MSVTLDCQKNASQLSLMGTEENTGSDTQEPSTLMQVCHGSSALTQLCTHGQMQSSGTSTPVALRLSAEQALADHYSKRTIFQEAPLWHSIVTLGFPIFQKSTSILKSLQHLLSMGFSVKNSTFRSHETTCCLLKVYFSPSFFSNRTLGNTPA
jgi:hypothetical protein